MADTKVSGLTALAGADVDPATDVLPIVDTSVTTTKKITVAGLKTALSIPVTAVANGKCLLTKSGSNLLLSQHDGQTVVDGADNILMVPSGGVTLAPTSATPGTTYNIYAYDNDADGALDTMEYSATAYTTATNGVKHKSGSTGKVLVGMARAVTGPAWINTADKRFVRTWFNDRGISGWKTQVGDVLMGSAPYVEISSTGRAEFIAWAGEIIETKAVGAVADVAAGALMYVATGQDGSALSGSTAAINIPVGGYIITQSAFGLPYEAAEGYHYISMMGGIGSGTSPTYYGYGLSGAGYSTKGHP